MADKACYTSLGYSKEELLKMNMVQLEGKLSPEEVGDKISGFLESGGGRFETQHKRKDGSLIDLEVSISLIQNKEKTLVAAFCRDITQSKKNEKALRESEEQFRVLYHNSPDMFVSVSPHDGKIYLCNQKFLEKTGYQEDEVIGKHILTMYHEESQKDAKEAFGYFVKKGFVRNKELILKKKDGGSIPVNLNANSVKDKNGKVLYSISSWRDISEQKQIEEVLFRAQYSLENSMIPTVWTNEKAEILYVNEAVGKYLGYSHEEIYSMNFQDVDIEWSADFWANHGLEILRKQKKMVFETRHKRKDGSLLPVEIIINYFKYKDSEFLTIYVLDTSEKKLALEVLKKSEEHAQLLFNQSAVIIWEEDFSEAKQKIETLREQGIENLDSYFIQNPEKLMEIAESIKVLQVNQKSLDFYRAENLQELETNISTWFMEESLDCFREEIIALCSGERSFEGELPVVTPEGEIKHLYLSVAVPEQYAESLEVVLVSFVDISERKKAERELETYRNQLEKLVRIRTAELEEVNKELKSFSYSVSHDLRAPLTRLDGFSKALQDSYADKLDEKGLHYLNRIRASSQYMANLINDMLLLSKISRQEIQMESIDIGTMAQKIFTNLYEAESERKVEINIHSNLYIKMDPGLCQLLMENLLNNAWKYSRKKNPSKIEVGKIHKDGKNWIYVKDNGMGFDMKYYDQLFIPFMRLHSSAQAEGTGIGLATVRRIINKHGGQIEAEGKPNQGATFYFWVQKDQDYII